MKLTTFISTALHVAFFAVLVFARSQPNSFEGYPTIIPVEIVELKPVAFTAPEVEKVAPEPKKTKAPAPKTEGVTLEKSKITEKKEEPPEQKPEKINQEPKEKKGKSAAESEKVRLDVKEFPFSYYLALLQARLIQNWEPPYNAVGKVVIYFKIQRNGHILQTRTELSSGDFLLDRAALRAVTLANPLPPLPQDFTDPHLGVHFEFTQGRN